MAFCAPTVLPMRVARLSETLHRRHSDFCLVADDDAPAAFLQHSCTDNRLSDVRAAEDQIIKMLAIGFSFGLFFHLKKIGCVIAAILDNEADIESHYFLSFCMGCGGTASRRCISDCGFSSKIIMFESTSQERVVRFQHLKALDKAFLTPIAGGI